MSQEQTHGECRVCRKSYVIIGGQDPHRKKERLCVPCYQALFPKESAAYASRRKTANEHTRKHGYIPRHREPARPLPVDNHWERMTDYFFDTFSDYDEEEWAKAWSGVEDECSICGCSIENDLPSSDHRGASMCCECYTRHARGPMR